MIEGFWRFKAFDSNIVTIYYYYSQVFISILMPLIFIQNIYRDPFNRMKKIILCIVFIILPFIYSQLYNNQGDNAWIIPNIAGLYLLQLIMMSWFVSDYRLFDDGLKEMTEDVLNSISDLAITTNSELKIVGMNAKAKEVFVYENSLTIQQLLTNNSTLTFQKSSAFIDTILGNNDSSKELNIEDRHHQKRVVEIKTAKLKKQHMDRGYTFLFSDLTDIRAKEIQLYENNRMKDQLFSVIGHDLRRPAIAFRGISKKINFLLNRKDFEGVQKLCTSLEQSASNLNGLLINLLGWALAQRNEVHIRPITIDSAEAILEMVAIYQQVADHKSINLVLKIEQPLLIVIDRQSFMTICRNLIDNAIKFTPPGGTISISSKRTGTTFRFTISDTGIGMEKEKLDDLFKISVGSTKGTLGESGSGIGLNLVKELVSLNQGTIEVRSKISEGTTFKVQFSDI